MTLLQEFREFRSKLVDEYGQNGFSSCEELVTAISHLNTIRSEQALAYAMTDSSFPEASAHDEAVSRVRDLAGHLVHLAKKANLPAPEFIARLSADPVSEYGSQLTYEIADEVLSN